MTAYAVTPHLSLRDQFGGIFGNRRGSDRPLEDPRVAEDYAYSVITDSEMLLRSSELPVASWQKGTLISKVKLILPGPTFYLPSRPGSYFSDWLGIGPSRPRNKENLFVLIRLLHDRDGNFDPEWKGPEIYHQGSPHLVNSIVTAKSYFSLEEDSVKKLVTPGFGPEITREQIITEFRHRLETQEAPSHPGNIPASFIQ